jgi:hypothetical protein
MESQYLGTKAKGRKERNSRVKDHLEIVIIAEMQVSNSPNIDPGKGQKARFLRKNSKHHAH